MPANKQTTEGSTPPRPPELAALGLSVAVGTAALQAWAAMGTEVVRFVRDRLQQDIKTQQAMLACTSLDDMRQVQADFCAAAQGQYAAEAVKMLDLIGKAAASGLTASTTARHYDDVPL